MTRKKTTSGPKPISSKSNKSNCFKANINAWPHSFSGVDRCKKESAQVSEAQTRCIAAAKESYGKLSKISFHCLAKAKELYGSLPTISFQINKEVDYVAHYSIKKSCKILGKWDCTRRCEAWYSKLMCPMTVCR